MFWWIWGAGLLLWAGALAVSAPWDLAVSAALADPSAAYGKLIAAFGEWPAWILVAGAVVLLATCRRTESRYGHLRPLAWAVLILAVIHPLIITQSLKFLWGRIRFRDLGVDLAGFTRFYVPAGVGAGLSFPSGHVAMAAVFNAVPFFLLSRGKTAQAVLALVLVSGFVLAVAWGRILAGAHYLSDCLFSAGLSLLLAAVTVRAFATARPSGGAGEAP